VLTVSAGIHDPCLALLTTLYLAAIRVQSKVMNEVCYYPNKIKKKELGWIQRYV
jgi:hypothetical protein